MIGPETQFCSGFDAGLSRASSKLALSRTPDEFASPASSAPANDSSAFLLELSAEQTVSPGCALCRKGDFLTTIDSTKLRTPGTTELRKTRVRLQDTVARARRLRAAFLSHRLAGVWEKKILLEKTKMGSHGGRRRRRTEVELLIEAAIRFGYVDVPGMDSAAGGGLAERCALKLNTWVGGRREVAGIDHKMMWARECSVGVSRGSLRRI
ncbi:unnamed protein product [Discula destructiva]